MKESSTQKSRAGSALNMKNKKPGQWSSATIIHGENMNIWIGKFELLCRWHADLALSDTSLKSLITVNMVSFVVLMSINSEIGDKLRRLATIWRNTACCYMNTVFNNRIQTAAISFGGGGRDVCVYVNLCIFRIFIKSGQ